MYVCRKKWYAFLSLQSYLKLIKKQQKELNTLKKKHLKVGDQSRAISISVKKWEDKDNHCLVYVHN